LLPFWPKHHRKFAHTKKKKKKSHPAIGGHSAPTARKIRMCATSGVVRPFGAFGPPFSSQTPRVAGVCGSAGLTSPARVLWSIGGRQRPSTRLRHVDHAWKQPIRTPGPRGRSYATVSPISFQGRTGTGAGVDPYLKSAHAVRRVNPGRSLPSRHSQHHGDGKLRSRAHLIHKWPPHEPTGERWAGRRGGKSR